MMWGGGGESEERTQHLTTKALLPQLISQLYHLGQSLPHHSSMIKFFRVESEEDHWGPELDIEQNALIRIL